MRPVGDDNDSETCRRSDNPLGTFAGQAFTGGCIEHGDRRPLPLPKDLSGMTSAADETTAEAYEGGG